MLRKRANLDIILDSDINDDGELINFAMFTNSELVDFKESFKNKVCINVNLRADQITNRLKISWCQIWLWLSYKRHSKSKKLTKKWLKVLNCDIHSLMKNHT